MSDFRHPDAIRALGSRVPGVLDWQVHCPVCGQEEVDVSYETRGGDHNAVTLHPDRDDYDSPAGTRGGYVRIDLQCPTGHAFWLVIANHKGAQFISIVPVTDEG